MHSDRPGFVLLLARDTGPETNRGFVWLRQIILRSSTFTLTVSGGTLDRASANLLFRVINYRYGKGSAIAITTNKGVSSWPSVLADDEVLAGAILDRLLHNATVLNVQGRSYRLKELDKQLQQQSSTSSQLTGTTIGHPVEATEPVLADPHEPAGEETSKI